MLNDAVSKAQVLETYAELYDVFDDYKEIQKELHKIYDKLNALPTVQPERRTGEWVHLGGDEWVCSACGHVIFTEGSWEHPLERGLYYCENCGAEVGERRE